MPAHDGIDVAPAILDEHASRVDSIAADMASAQRAGDTVRMGGAAYGQLCTIVPVLVDRLQGMVVSGIDAAHHSLRDSADRLRTVARSYASTDQRTQQEFDRLRRAR